MLVPRPRTPRVAAVDEVSFEVAAGEVFGLLGPNGAGKTTIFRMLSTMILPDRGSAVVGGFDVVTQSANVRRILAAVPADERSLHWRLSARENLLLFAALHRVPQSEASARVQELLGTVGLGTAGNKLVAAFSSGMRQRLLIARALLARPRILLLDEPTRALDPLSAQEFRRFLRREIVEHRRCTIVLATHNTEEAFGFCDRVAVLDRGRVLATGATTDLAARFGEERYRLLTTDPDHPALSALERCGLLRSLCRSQSSSPDWMIVECAISGDPARSAQVLKRLVESGVPVARLERVDTSLADLITRIIGAAPKSVAHA